jgi:chaperonin GroES
MSSLTLQPLYDRIIIKPLETEQITASGIIIPDTANKEKPQQGKVIAVGSGRITDEGKILPMHVKVGDTVLFSKYVPDEVTIKNETYLVVREDSVLAIIK